jgi:P27 family predicted phage terminase small subunit
MGRRGPKGRSAEEHLRAGDPSKIGKKKLLKMIEEEKRGKPAAVQPSKAKPKAKPAEKVVAITDSARLEVLTPVLPAFVKSKEAIDHWNDIVPKLVAEGLVRAVDSVPLGQYCNYIGKAIKAENELAKHKSEFIKCSGNTFMPRPEVKAAKEYWAEAMKLLKQLGLTPGARKKRGGDLDPQAEEETQEDDATATDSLDDPLCRPVGAG